MSDGVAIGRSTRRAAPVLGLLGDDRLAKLAAGGSASAFAAIYKRHHQAIYRYCLSIVGNEHDARDALQETMASAFHAINGSEREIAVRPWLFRIAHNEAVTVLRRKRRELPDDEIERIASGDDVQDRDDLRELLEDLGLLTARQRSALVMRELSGLSFSEIGEALEVSPVGAKQAVYEARVALRDLREGRTLECAEIRKKISADDRRLLRGRQVRAHLKACAACREFEHEISQRRANFAALAPLPAPAALGILQGLLGGGTGGGGIAIGTGASLAGVAKLGIAGVIALGVGAGALEVRDHARGDSTDATQHQVATPDQSATTEAAETIAPTNGASVGGESDKSSARGGRADKPGNDGSEGASAHSPAAGPDGHANENGHAGDATGATATGESSAPGNPDSNGNGPASTPPGHGGTPPGQGGNPPGLGAPAPGHGGTPPGQTTAPGQSTTAPTGNSGTAPGHTGLTPSSGASPPSQVPVSPPGNSGNASGHSGLPLDLPPGHADDGN
jgi:RNA polymerase sigma factor (sigma-70 family)